MKERWHEIKSQLYSIGIPSAWWIVTEQETYSEKESGSLPKYDYLIAKEIENYNIVRKKEKLQQFLIKENNYSEINSSEINSFLFKGYADIFKVFLLLCLGMIAFFISGYEIVEALSRILFGNGFGELVNLELFMGLTTLPLSAMMLHMGRCGMKKFEEG